MPRQDEKNRYGESYVESKENATFPDYNEIQMKAAICKVHKGGEAHAKSSGQ